MFEGKRFFPETGTPIWNTARSSVVFAVWLPEPFTVAMWSVNLLSLGDKSASRCLRAGSTMGRTTHGPISVGVGQDRVGASPPLTHFGRAECREGFIIEMAGSFP